MKSRFAAAAVAYCLSALTAQACSFETTLSRFEPDMSWQQLPGPGQSGEGGAYFEATPKPRIGRIDITRGTEAAGSSCADAGTLSFDVSLPAGSSYELADFGIYFRVIKGGFPDEVFPDQPVAGEVLDGKIRVFLVWLDGDPSQQSRIHAKVEVFLVSKGLHIGPSQVITIRSN
jgi:hypothetical protein